MRFLLGLITIGVASGNYTMVDHRPRCRYELGTNYCPPPSTGSTWTDSYMSYPERIHLTLLNIARTNPMAFRSSYPQVLYACTPQTQQPLSYETGLHQAAKQQAWLLSQPACQFMHNTCSRFCSLYDSCDWTARVKKYITFRSRGLGENIALSSTDALVVLRQWFASGPHCTNIFGPHTHAGIGNVGRYWVQNFATATIPKYIVASGAHWVYNQALRFLLTVYQSNVSAVSVRYAGRVYRMGPHLGNTTYMFDTVLPPSNSSCRTYYFMVVYDNQSYRFPEVGSYQTSHTGRCTKNWVSY